METELISLGGPLGVVAVTVEDALEVLLQEVLGNLDTLLTSLDAVGNLGEELGSQGVEDGVHQGDVLGGAHGTELETMTAVREGRGAVAVLRGGVDDGQEIRRG